MKNTDNHTELHIETTIELQPKNKTAGRLGGFFIMLFLLFLGALGFTFAWPSIFGFPCDSRLLAAGIFLLCLVFTLLFRIPSLGKRLLLLSALTLLYAWVWIRRTDDILAGLRTIAENIIAQINKYYHMNLLLDVDFVPKGNSWQTALFLFMFMYLVTGLMAYALLRRAGSATIFFWCVLPFTAALLVGKVPSLVSVLCMLFCFLGTAGIARPGTPRLTALSGKTGGWLLVLLSLCTLAASFLVQPPLEQAYPKMQSLRTKVTTFVNQDLWSKISRIDEWLPWGSKGKINGQLGRSQGFSYTGVRALTVTTDEKPEETLYLRGFIGGSYTGEEWLPVTPDSFHSFFGSLTLPGDGNPDFLIQNQLYEAARLVNMGNGTEHSGLQKIDIEKITADSTYAYLPYAAQVSNVFSLDGDGDIKAPGQKNIQASYYPLSCFFSDDNSAIRYTVTTSDDHAAHYNAYAGQEYLSYPKERLQNLKQLCDTLEPGGILDARDQIISAIQSRAVYNLNTGPCPEDKDFSEYFLFEEKEGYCVHFATTAALMFRMKKIPSRYVAGYIVPPSLFQENEDGTYTAQVRDDKAHAWAEIYLDRLGWLPVEATPAYNQLTRSPDSWQEGVPPSPSQPTEAPAVSPAGSSPSPSPTPETAQQGAEDPGDSFTDPPSDTTAVKLSAPLGAFLLSLLVLATVIAAGCFWRQTMLRRQRRNFGTSDYNANIRRIYSRLHSLLVFSRRIPREADGQEDFARQLAAAVPSLPLGKAEAYWELVLAANYSQKELSREDSLLSLQIYRMACGAIYSHLGPLKKIIYRFLRVFS